MEQEASVMIREAVDAAKPGVVLYTEESPCDVSSQYQDGSFTYAMNQIQAREGSVPLNLFRFAIPDFKTFEILYCDKPTGSWATGVGWTFFNGEGLWLEGPGKDWFAAGTREMIQKCHALLRDHRLAFTTLTPEPLVSTCARGIFANLFASEEEEIWTLYNAHHRTYSGPVIEVLHREGTVWQDAWNPGEIRVKRLGDRDRIWTRLAPQGVGCLERVRRAR
jgi:hypothetical protein